MRSLPLWLLALWPLRACRGLAPAAAWRARGPDEEPPPAAPLGGAAPGRSPFDSVVEASRERPHDGGGVVQLRGVAAAARTGDAEPPRRAAWELRLPRPLRWLHIPKTGTSFIATIWNYACGQEGAPLDLFVEENYTLGCGECYDYALMDRYPRDLYCKPGMLAPQFSSQHRPVLPREYKAYSVVGFFRRPAQRLISAHRNGRHANGMTSADRERLSEACGDRDASCYARWPGIAGCSARILAGHRCADHRAKAANWDRGVSHVEKAVGKVAKMAFVGITEEWDESVCLFHLMFGGRVSPAEFTNFHLGMRRKNQVAQDYDVTGDEADYDETELDGFVDEADELVYAAAKRQYAAQRAKYVKGKSACTDAQDISQAHALYSEDSCARSGLQCGLLEGRLDCGRCPPARLGRNLSGPAPTCTASGQCSVAGLGTSPEVFSWYREDED